MSYPLPSNITSDMAATLLMRINDSFVSWDGGVTSNSNGTISLDAFNDIAEVIYNDTLMANQVGNTLLESEICTFILLYETSKLWFCAMTS